MSKAQLLIISSILVITSILSTTQIFGESSLNRIQNPPLGLPALKLKAITEEKIRLGRRLFFEKRLSRDGTISCATCHKPQQFFTETDRQTSEGFKEQKNRRNTPSVINAAYYERLHQDGRETSLKTQFILPLTSHDEMASRSVGYVIKKLEWIPEYQALFRSAFGNPPTADNIGEALAAYQSTLVSANSRFDRWHFGKEKNLLSATEIKGFKLFTGKADCVSCHQISKKHALFTDNAFHDIGHGWDKNHKKPEKQQDKGRYEVTLDPLDMWRFRTPSLRNIAKTAPYMHDGAFNTLEDVIRFYNKGGVPHPGQDQRIKKLNLTNEEIAALVAFLETLTGDNLNKLTQEKAP